MMRVRMGVVGTGRMAVTMIGAAARLKTVTVRGVASASGSIQRARNITAAFGISDAYSHPALMLAREDLDLIYVATATSAHAAISIAALEAGKSVLCEKPFAVSHSEGNSVIDAARKSRRLFVEAFWTMLLPAHRRVEEIIDTRGIGTATHLTASFGYPPHTLSREASDAHGGVLFDRAVYPVSLAVKLMGPVERVDAALIFGADDVDMEASLQLLHASGGVSHLAASHATLLSNEAVISGTGGSVTIEAPLLGSEMITIRKYEGRPSAGTVKTLYSLQDFKERLRAIPTLRRLRRRLTDGRHEHMPYGTNQYLPLLQHVVELVRSEKRESDVVPLELSQEVARVIDLAGSAARRLHKRSTP